MSMVDGKMEESRMVGLEPNIENAVIQVVYDIVKSHAFWKMTDVTLESIKDNILKECGSHISDLALEPIACEGVIEIMFKMAERTICVKCFSPGSERWLGTPYDGNEREEKND